MDALEAPQNSWYKNSMDGIDLQQYLYPLQETQVSEPDRLCWWPQIGSLRNKYESCSTP